ncbi:MAG: hypothetical protein U5K43_10245 [Halofilum sp. (in: g-proteobacteria)]|nr:hypothetical protein [Halofilum sp. (in: g-proteobacteria)]
MLALALVRAAIVAGVVAFRVLLFLPGLLLRGAAAVPVLVRDWCRRRRVARLARLADSIEDASARFGDWTTDRWIAALLLVVGARGRGEAAVDAADRFAEALQSAGGDRGLAVARDGLRDVAAGLDGLRDRLPSGVEGDLALVVVAARRLGARLPPERLAEVLLAVDERVIAAAPRTRLQDRMLEVFADAAGLRLEPEAEEPAGAGDTGAGAPDEVAGPVVDVNTADFEALQRIPHVGPERAH